MLTEKHEHAVMVPKPVIRAYPLALGIAIGARITEHCDSSRELLVAAPSEPHAPR